MTGNKICQLYSPRYRDSSHHLVSDEAIAFLQTRRNVGRYPEVKGIGIVARLECKRPILLAVLFEELYFRLAIDLGLLVDPLQLVVL